MDYMKKLSYETIFITVGTTEFDQLIHYIDNQEFLDVIKLLGCKQLIIQYGRGVHIPQVLCNICTKYGIECDIYRFKDTLKDDMNKSSLIISHCGAGSILEALEMEKPLIVVVNDTLQGNHQTELSDALAEQGYCLSTFPSSIITTLLNINIQGIALKPFPKTDHSIFPTLLDSLYGFV